jgi:hypothetical protein
MALALVLVLFVLFHFSGYTASLRRCWRGFADARAALHGLPSPVGSGFCVQPSAWFLSSHKKNTIAAGVCIGDAFLGQFSARKIGIRSPYVRLP